MVIYGEYLFAENFLTGIILLLLTAHIAGGKIKKLRLLAAGVVCGMAGFTIFLAVSGVKAIIIRMIIAFAVSGIFFGREGLLKKTIILLSLTFLSGGAAMAFLLWQQIPAVSGNGALYVHPLTYGSLLLWGSIAFMLTWVFVKIIKGRRMTDIISGRACLYINGCCREFEALVDSGNSLKEPFTGRPVSLIGKSAAEELETVIPAERFVLIPYHAVGTEKGLLRGFRADEMVFCGKVYKEAVIGFYTGNFDEFDMLLSREVLNEDII